MYIRYYNIEVVLRVARPCLLYSLSVPLRPFLVADPQPLIPRTLQGINFLHPALKSEAPKFPTNLACFTYVLLPGCCRVSHIN